jgi:hypothetical protein
MRETVKSAMRFLPALSAQLKRPAGAHRLNFILLSKI